MSSTQFTSRSRTINKKHEKQRPLRIVSRHSIIDGRVTTAEDLVSLVDDVTTQLSSGIHDLRLQQNVISMCNALKCCAHQFEVVYKDQLDRAFVAIRNGSQDERLDLMTRIHLLELIELRAKQWRHNDSMDSYYSAKLSNLEEQSDSVTMESSSISMGSSIMGGLSSPSTPPILGTGDVLKNSGKFSKPTRIPGKNYCKDEVVIRNSDSGKVMGIKGRRVHMIEELSETIISFQRVNPGAKERLVQITGTSEDKIHYAKDLIKETIQRNASPVRGVEKASGIGDSSSSLNSSASDEIYQQINSSKSFHNISSGDTSFGEYKHTVTVGNLSLKITGSNLTLVRTAKLVLDEHFSKWTGDLDQPGDGIEYFRFPEEPPVPEIPFQELPNNQNYPDIIHSNVNEIAKTLPEAEIQSANKTSVPMELTYEFLLTCATGPYAKRVPANWERIQREFPNIVRKSGEVLEIYKGRSIAASVVSFAANDNELE